MENFRLYCTSFHTSLWLSVPSISRSIHTRCRIFSSKSIRKRLAAARRGSLSAGKGKGRKRERESRKGREREGERIYGREGKGNGGRARKGREERDGEKKERKAREERRGAFRLF